MLPSFKKLLFKARSHAGFRLYAANASWMFAEQMARMFVALFVSLWVARHLGPEQFGLFSYVITFASLFTCVAKLGLDSIVVRDLVREPNLRDVYLGTAFWLKLTSAFIMLGVVFIAMQFENIESTTKLYIFIIASGTIFQSYEVVDFYFQSKVLSKFVAICKLSQLLLSSLFKLYLIFIEASLLWFVIVSVIDQVVLAVTLFLAYQYQKIGEFYTSFNLSIGKRLLKDSWPMLFSGLAVMLYMRIDVIMLQSMVGAKEVGIYAAATKISEIWYFLPNLIVASVSPAIIQAQKLDSAKYVARLQQLYFVMAWLAVGISLPLALLSVDVISVLFGDDFASAGPVLAIHLWASVAVFLGVANSQYLLAENLLMVSLYRTCAGLICNVLLNLLLIPTMGAKGAAISTVLSYFVATFSIVFFKATRAHAVYLLFAPFSLLSFKRSV